MKNYSIKDAGPVRPDFAWMRQRAARIVAFGFGSGLLRPAPGTWGTLLAWLLWQPLAALLPSPLHQAIVIAFAFAVGVWACDRAGRDLGVADHGGMVWDEIVAFWAVLWVVPDALAAQACGFVLFRLFDIAKPPPIAYFDRRMKHGLGVMWDDVVAAFYTVLVFAVASRLV